MIDIKPVLIMAGGTGGHVYPALAVADVLREQGIPVVWLGTRSGLEASVVAKAGYPIKWLNITGLRGKGLLTLLLAPMKLIMACVQAYLIIKETKPCAVLGMGGFVSGPGGLMAWLSGKPLLIHEQNAVAGLTNKILAKIADKVMVAFPNTLGAEAIEVGNPVRKDILKVLPPKERMDKAESTLKLLVVGGSLGAVRLNELLPESISKIDEKDRPVIIHQTGKNNYQQACECYAQYSVKADVQAYIEDMASVYAWADLVICRSGAMTIFELSVVGVASILVPYPSAVDDHQTANAMFLSNAGAAIVKQQKDIDSQWLCDTIKMLAQQRERLIEMANSARLCARPDAANDVAHLCRLAGGLV